MLIQPDYVGLTRRSPHRTDFVGLTRRSPHRITLRVYGCGSLLAHICVDHAYSFLSTLCMLKNCLRVDVSYIKKSPSLCRDGLIRVTTLIPGICIPDTHLRCNVRTRPVLLFDIPGLQHFSY